MKIKVTLENDETLEDADNFLAKAMVKKVECSGGERYNDDALNEALDLICDQHSTLITKLTKDIKGLVERGISSKRHY